jgi:hypothetical protein
MTRRKDLPPPGGTDELSAALARRLTPAAVQAADPAPRPPTSISDARRGQRADAPAAAPDPGPPDSPASTPPAAASPAPAARTAPAQTAPAAAASPYRERISITLTIGQIQALRIARAQDGIQATARIRAMIGLWQDDPELRDRIDRLARDWR